MSQPTKQAKKNLLRQAAANVAGIVDKRTDEYGFGYEKAIACLAVLYPEGIPPDKLPEAEFVGRVLEKLARISEQPTGQQAETWSDIAGTAINAAVYQEGYYDPDE